MDQCRFIIISHLIAVTNFIPTVFCGKYRCIYNCLIIKLSLNYVVSYNEITVLNIYILISIFKPHT